MKGKKSSPLWTFIALAILALFIIFVVYPLVLVLYKSVINPSDNSFTIDMHDPDNDGKEKQA